MNKPFLIFAILVSTILVIMSGGIIFAQDSTPTIEPTQICTLNPHQYTDVATSHGMVTGGETKDIEDTINQGVRDADSYSSNLAAVGTNEIQITELQSSTPSAPVLILIIDDFSTDLPFAHGWDVLQVAENARDSITLARKDMNIRPFIHIDTINTAPHRSDFQDNTAELAVHLLTEKFPEFSSYSKIVLSMSFVFIPCTGAIFISPSLSLEYDMIRFFDQDYYANSNANTFVESLAFNLASQLEQNPQLLDDYQLPEYETSFFVNEPSTYDAIAEIQNASDRDEGALGNFILEEIIAYRENTQPNFETSQLLVTRYLITSALANYLTNQMLENPLKVFLEAHLEDNIFIPVAGSGNWGPGDAYAPGAWDTVMSVSGSDENNPNQLWAESNNGEIKATAAWHKVAGERFVKGTSFSTPLVSVMSGYLSSFYGCSFESFMDTFSDRTSLNKYYIPELWSRLNCNMLD